MQNGERLNPIDEICKRLSLAYLLANKDDPETEQKYADVELDGLYEFAKIIFSISRNRQFQPRNSELLLEAIGLQVKYPPTPEPDLGNCPNIFIANSSGCCLLDGAIGTILLARLGLPGSIVATRNQHFDAKREDVVSLEHPRIQKTDPRCDAQIAKTNTKSVLKMRNVLASGHSLMLFPGEGTYQPDQTGKKVLDGSFDRLAPVLLACKDLRPRLHLYHFDYEMPSWWTELLCSDQSHFHAARWKAILGLERQVAKVRHVKSVSIVPSMGKQQRYELCCKLLKMTTRMTTELGHEHRIEAV